MWPRAASRPSCRHRSHRPAGRSPAACFRRPEERAHGGTDQSHETCDEHGRVQPGHECGMAPAVIASASFAGDPLGPAPSPATRRRRRGATLRQCIRHATRHERRLEGGGHGRRQNGAAHRGPEDATELDRGRLDPAGDAGLVLGDVPDDGIGGGCHDQPDAEAQQDERGPEMAVRGVHLEGDEREDGQRRGQQAEGDGQPGPESVDEPRAQWSREREGDREGRRRRPAPTGLNPCTLCR